MDISQIGSRVQQTYFHLQNAACSKEDRSAKIVY